MKISYYQDYLCPETLTYLQKIAKPVDDVDYLTQIGDCGGLENQSSLLFLCELYNKVAPILNNVLNQRKTDRKFIDERMRSYSTYNKEYEINYRDPLYQTVLSDQDSKGRIVFGPNEKTFSHRSNNKKIAPLPDYLKGDHVTLFGPPDNPKLSINAMNAFHRKIDQEPSIIEEILSNTTHIPKWGADDEDSKTPLRSDLIQAAINLSGCINNTIEHIDPISKKKYQLANDKLSLPIKRFPGLSLPCSFLFFKNNPLPLHLYDFALHFFKHWDNPKALVFYVPKLENEEEASYIHKMIFTAETMLKKIHPQYEMGTIRLIIVLENPRAIFRVNEIMDELYPYFAGASLGWHDFLASTARLFKEDGHYRIPVKADPNIVINYIKGSHDLLANIVGARGGIKIGGMYGVLPIQNDLNSPSFQITLIGFFRDVITQMKRNLSGFWVAHPDFVRIGMAIMAAWRDFEKNEDRKLKALITNLIHNKSEQNLIWEFILASDIKGLEVTDPLYHRALIVTDTNESTLIANNHPEEIRYNIFQTLQYLTDWLSGHGCVALPALINNIPVRVMDDLATAERSRWEVWHEIYHHRFSIYEFIKIVHEEMNFIRRDLSDDKKIVQVKFSKENAKWYAVATKLILKIMTDKKPVEFLTELLIPFTIESIRQNSDPWTAIKKISKFKYLIREDVEKFNYYFEVCGNLEFSKIQSQNSFLDKESIKSYIMSFTQHDILEAANFHGDIGENKNNLDSHASGEQKNISTENQKIKNELLELGKQYHNKFGLKFLISAKDKSACEIKSQLIERIKNSLEQELQNAKKALLEITLKRIEANPLDSLKETCEKIVKDSQVSAVQISISQGKSQIQNLCFGKKNSNINATNIDETSLFEIASLSKTYAAAFALSFFEEKAISLDTRVNDLLKDLKSTFRLNSTKNPDWSAKVCLRDLIAHSALNMHYVLGFDDLSARPPLEKLLLDPQKYGLTPIDVINMPGEVFSYSGAGFLVLEYILEKLSNNNLNKLVNNFLADLELSHTKFGFETLTKNNFVHGQKESGEYLKKGIKFFPNFAAGMLGTSSELNTFLEKIALAYHNIEGCSPISHDTAVLMLDGKDKGCQDFMSANMGLGVFVVEAQDNKFMLHQGANDGFRAIYLYCFSGPDCYKGLSILCNGELRGVKLNALLTQTILKHLNISGINFSKFQNDFSLQNLSQEEIVNIGYKNLIFDAFIPCQPDAIEGIRTLDPLAKDNLCTTSKILKVTNEKFARAENLLSPYLPIFDPTLFNKQGKTMDSWESARHNPYEWEELIFQLETPREIHFIFLSTQFHLGNQVEYLSLEAKARGEQDYTSLLPKIKMDGHSFVKIRLESNSTKWETIKVKVYPDGGLTRLGLYTNLAHDEAKNFLPLVEAKSITYTEKIPQATRPLVIDIPKVLAKQKDHLTKKNYASLANGAKIISASDEHYAPAIQVISPFSPLHMFDGTESKRSRKKDHKEELIIELANPIDIGEIILDFTYFVNNNPVAIKVEFLTHDDDEAQWKMLIEKTNVKAFAGNKKSLAIKRKNLSKKLRFTIFPDGGINRIIIHKKHII